MGETCEDRIGLLANLQPSEGEQMLQALCSTAAPFDT